MIQGIGVGGGGGAEAAAAKRRIKEIKIPRAQFRPLQSGYRESLEKLRAALRGKKARQDSVGQEEKSDQVERGGAENENVESKQEEEVKTSKRKKKFITNPKFLKRLKQIKKLNE